MAAIDDLIQQIDNPELRKRIQREVDRLTRQKKFGLVFEEHLPECTPLYEIPVAVGGLVAKNGAIQEIYRVLKIEDKQALCQKRGSQETEMIPVADLVSIAEFGNPIYPYLKPVDTVCHAPDSDLWHTLIEADNYHALQLLDYLYHGQVDCIYIDPPYNTGAKDWKYNNDYVDAHDNYRHSKWLSMMEKRLKLAKKLLNPKDSVLIVTIDEKEYLHLGCLLEEMFPEAYIQMISTTINPKGVSNLHGFKRSDEYIYFLFIGDGAPVALPLASEWSPSAIKASKVSSNSKKIIGPGWTSMMRRGSHSGRYERPGLYYAIYADPKLHKIVYIGNSLPLEKNRDCDIPGLIQILPIRTNGEEGCWQVSPKELDNRIKQGRIKLGKKTNYGYVVNYLPDGEYQKVLNGQFKLQGYEEDGSLIACGIKNNEVWVAPTQWKIPTHDASAYGSTLLANILSGKKFGFPKSLYAVHDTIRFFVANKPNALILDFFAGSGTTLHAVNLLNAEDGGQRRCIMVTNNEVSDSEAKSLKKQGYKPGDPEWEKWGIARYVTWPRTVCSIEGHDVNGQPLKGNYLGSDQPMADGFSANVAFFKLGFLDKMSVALGLQLEKLIPVLWMKAGCIGPCPAVTDANQEMLIFSRNKFAVLVESSAFSEFAQKIESLDIQTVYLITDYEPEYRSMISQLHVPHTYQLYRDYLDNFRINQRRD